MRPLLTAVATLTLTACSDPQTVDRAPASIEAPAASSPALAVQAPTVFLTADGFGALRIGMTRAEIKAALSAGAMAPPRADPLACEIFHPAGAPEGLSLLIENDRLSRIDLGDDSRVETADGLGLGSTVNQVRASHPDAIIEPHKYIVGAQTLTVWDGHTPSVPYVVDPQARGIRYVTDTDGRIAAIRAGGPSIQQAEGCG